jgi:hypothetical protein
MKSPMAVPITQRLYHKSMVLIGAGVPFGMALLPTHDMS